MARSGKRKWRWRRGKRRRWRWIVLGVNRARNREWSGAWKCAEPNYMHFNGTLVSGSMCTGSKTINQNMKISLCVEEKERNTWSTQFEWCVVHRAQVFWWSESTQTHRDENWKRVFICSDGPQNQLNETTMCWLISSLIAWFYWMLCRSVFLHSAFQYSRQSFVYNKFIVYVNLLGEKNLGHFTSIFGTAHE